ncbi:RNA binding protein, heterogenous nuclear RNP-K like protein [Neodidymelliopsis sp. IMI 364377]|nr:RNA binding protein, heterogenous nuclear RNP-K like protein [Neodidymelliopsis sp. IMI 364377]
MQRSCPQLHSFFHCGKAAFLAKSQPQTLHTGDSQHALYLQARSSPRLPSLHIPGHPYNMSAEDAQNAAGNANAIADQLDRLNVDGEAADVTPRTEQEYAESQLTLRAIVSSKEAGVIIGKAGKNVADLRDETGVRAGVSKVVQGVHDRVLSVTGSLSGISKAYGLVAKGLLDGAPAMGMGGVVRNDGTHPIRLLISHNQMGTIIGRQGLKIKQIQDASGVRMVAQKEMLPQSTERIVEVQGSPSGIEKALWEIGKCLIDDHERGYGTVLYNPAVRVQPGAGPLAPTNGGAAAGLGSGRSYNRTGHGADFSDSPPSSFQRRSGSDAASRPPPPTHTEDGEEMQTQNISIPSDMVGCIIGRGGSKISEIRKTSGARISIAKAPHDDTGERMFTITGSASANEKALYLLYENLEAEKMRRSQAQD